MHHKAFAQFLHQTQKYYGDDFFEKFLLCTKEDQIIFRILIENLIGENLKNILMHQDKMGNTILHYALNDTDNLSRVIESIQNCRNNNMRNVIKELLKVQNEEGQNVLMKAVCKKKEDNLKFLIDFIKKFLGKNEMDKFLCDVDKKVNNIIHLAAINCDSKLSFDLIWQTIIKNVSSKNHKSFLLENGEHDRNALQLSSYNNLVTFSSILELTQNYCEDEEFVDFIHRKNSYNENLLSICVSTAPKTNLEFLSLNIFGVKDFHNFWKTSKGLKNRNLLNLVSCNENQDSMQYLWQIFEEKLDQDEIFKILDERDEDNNNLLHNVTTLAKTKESFSYVLQKILKHLENDTKKLKSYLLSKGSKGRNVLLQSVDRFNKEIFFYIIENIVLKFFELEDLLNEQDADRKNFFQYLGQFSSFSTLKILFNVLERKFLMSNLIEEELSKVKSDKYKMNLFDIRHKFERLRKILNDALKTGQCQLCIDFTLELLDERHNEIFHLKLLNLYDSNISFKLRGEIFRSAIECGKINVFHALSNTSNVKEISEETLKDFLQHDLFIHAVKCNNLEVSKMLLNNVHKIPDLLSFELFKEAVDLSVENKFSDIIEELMNYSYRVSDEEKKALFENKKNDSDLNQINTEPVTKPLQSEGDILQAIDKLHENIKSGNLQRVREFSKNFKDQRLCYGNQEVCAIERAIDCGQFKIFSFLRANGFYTDRGSELENKIEILSENQKNEIRIENFKYAADYPDAFIGILLSKCRFDAISSVSSSEVLKMLTDLSQIDKLRPFLEIASQAQIEIIFDFATESVKGMIPGYDEHTMGLAFFNEKKLYVGQYRDKFLRYGTFMHELTHMVLYLIYENGCLPYCKDDLERVRTWHNVLENERKHYIVNPEIVENIIRWVFQCYNEGYEQRAELAVRPNHIMAQYIENPQRVHELREIHTELFNYLQNFIIPDLQIQNVLRLIELNKAFEVIDRIENSDLQLQSSENFEMINHTHKKIVIISNIPKVALNKLYQEIKLSTQNKLHVKVRNIFVDVEKLSPIYFKNEIESLLEDSNIDRIVFDVTDPKNVDKAFEFVQDLKFSAQIYVVCGETIAKKFIDELNFETLSITIRVENLTPESHHKLLNKSVNFQGRNFPFFTITDKFSDESLELLCLDKDILINFDENLRSSKNFIPRIVERGNQQLNLDEFVTQKDQILILSGAVGIGKTALLKKVGEIFLRQFPNHWISFITLRNFIERISECSLKTFEDSYVEILNLPLIEREIFMEKFAKGEVKILFDGLDEISLKYRNEMLKLFKLFKAQDKNQILITTGTHFEHDLRENLNIESFKIKILTKEDQIHFLCGFWKNSHDDKNFIKKCAQELIQKISEIVNDSQNFIGVPLILQTLAKLYANEINEEFSKKIQMLKLSEIFQRIIEQSLTVFSEKFPSELMKNSLKRSNIYQAFDNLAIVNYFGEDVANKLELPVVDSDWPLEEIARIGIISYDENKRVKFNHETYGQHFLSNIIVDILTTCSSLSDPQIELLQTILTDERFEIARMFLSENFEKISRYNRKLFKNEISENENESFVEKLTKNLREEISKKIWPHQN